MIAISFLETGSSVGLRDGTEQVVVMWDHIVKATDDTMLKVYSLSLKLTFSRSALAYFLFLRCNLSTRSWRPLAPTLMYFIVLRESPLPSFRRTIQFVLITIAAVLLPTQYTRSLTAYKYT
jgi:hypothetical protein